MHELDDCVPGRSVGHSDLFEKRPGGDQSAVGDREHYVDAKQQPGKRRASSGAVQLSTHLSFYTEGCVGNDKHLASRDFAMNSASNARVFALQARDVGHPVTEVKI